MHTLLRSYKRDLQQVSSSFIGYTHGIDSDGVYVRDIDLNPNTYPAPVPLIFTKFNREQLDDYNRIIDFYKLDPNKKNIIYLGTAMEWEFIAADTPKSTFEKTFSGLVKLKEKYNVIVRPHPLLPSSSVKKLMTEFVIAPQGLFLSFVPFYDIADVIIGTPSAGGSTATVNAETPLILLIPTKSWNAGLDMLATQEKNGDLVLNPSMVIQQTEENIDLVSAVVIALTDYLGEKEKSKKRRYYFNYWFGCIDGYENYRSMMRNLSYHAGIDIEALKEIYQRFPLHNNKPLCKYIPLEKKTRSIEDWMH